MRSLSSSALEETALARLALDIQNIQDLLKGKSDETIRLKRELELLEGERPGARHDECLVQASIADQNRKLNER
ncbi:MAG TPA: hypothetical protein VNO32_56630 [Candidatus Acidoferrum sp.]|nr:hypothetical protein [Candidatus Acidoferrum sp.]